MGQAYDSASLLVEKTVDSDGWLARPSREIIGAAAVLGYSPPGNDDGLDRARREIEASSEALSPFRDSHRVVRNAVGNFERAVLARSPPYYRAAPAPTARIERPADASDPRSIYLARGSAMVPCEPLGYERYRVVAAHVKSFAYRVCAIGVGGSTFLRPAGPPCGLGWTHRRIVHGETAVGRFLA